MPDKIFTVVVTHNRKHDLINCLYSLLSQSHQPDKIIIIDNGSSNDTEGLLKKSFPQNSTLFYMNTNKNLGGAGGFHYGAKQAFEHGAAWIWLMDDDCVPEKDCLEKLIKHVKSKRNIYSPIVFSANDRSTTLWGIKAKKNTGSVEVVTLPFNGFLIHRESIKEIGLPEKRFFIYGDDTEYNLRAKASGRKVIMVTESIMYHPHKNKLSRSGLISMFRNNFWVYYKLRNAIIIYKKYKYFSVNQLIMFAASMFFFILTLNFKQLKLWIRGLIDGLRGRLYVRRL